MLLTVTLVILTSNYFKMSFHNRVSSDVFISVVIVTRDNF